MQETVVTLLLHGYRRFVCEKISLQPWPGLIPDTRSARSPQLASKHSKNLCLYDCCTNKTTDFRMRKYVFNPSHTGRRLEQLSGLQFLLAGICFLQYFSPLSSPFQPAKYATIPDEMTIMCNIIYYLTRGMVVNSTLAIHV